MESFFFPMESLVEWSKYFYVLFPKGVWLLNVMNGWGGGKAKQENRGSSSSSGT